MKPLMREILDSAPHFNGTAEVKPDSRKRGNRHYKQLVDRGLVVPAVLQLAKLWETDYETAHRMIKENNVDIHRKRKAVA